MAHPNTAGLGLGSVAEVASQAIPEDAWDLPPMLGVVVGHPDAISVQGLPVPDEIWQKFPTCEVIHGLAERMTADPPPPPELGEDEVPLGLLCCAEGYAAEPPPGTSREEIEALEEWCESHSLADHPWGREVRSTYIVGFDGSLHTVVHVRGSGKHEADSFEHLDDWPSGCLIDALRKFTIAVRKAME